MVFENAPTLKAVLLIGSVLSYWNSVTKKGYPLFYTSTFDWILSSLVLYHTRHVEQMLGPTKFIAFQTASTIISGMGMYFIGQTPNLALWSLSTIAPFYTLIPYSHLTQFGPVPFTNKWYVYAFALQMILTHPLYILAPITSFLVYNKWTLKLKTKWLFKCDDLLNKIGFTSYKDQTFFGRAGRRFQQEPRPPRHAAPTDATTSPTTTAQPSAGNNVNQVAIQQLTDMGFSPEQSRQALLATNNNLEEALMLLLSQ